MWYCLRARQKDQWKIIRNLEIDAYIWTLVLYQGDIVKQWYGDLFNSVGTTEEKYKMWLFSTPYTKINFKRIIDINMIGKTIMLLDDRISYDLLKNIQDAIKKNIARLDHLN